MQFLFEFARSFLLRDYNILLKKELHKNGTPIFVKSPNLPCEYCVVAALLEAKADVAT